jgi:2-polyprenyl-6-methoxyphenol hydroxylase-like FAD-dependent oxidoreductase
MGNHQAEVLVIGAGPTGLALATTLQKAGTS